MFSIKRFAAKSEKIDVSPLPKLMLQESPRTEFVFSILVDIALLCIGLSLRTDGLTPTASAAT